MSKFRNTTVTLVATCIGLAAVWGTASAGRSRARGARIEGVVNINEAPVAKLALLPHIGKSKARAIVRYRSRKRFERASDLIRVPGIGKATFARLKPYVRVSGPTTIRRVGRKPARGKRSRPARKGRKGGKSKRRRK